METKNEPPSRRVLGRYLVADPAICHGQLTFRGTRVFVSDVLEQVASGVPWESIAESWNHSVNDAAIAEAVRLAREALLAHHHELSEEPFGVEDPSTRD